MKAFAAGGLVAMLGVSLLFPILGVVIGAILAGYAAYSARRP